MFCGERRHLVCGERRRLVAAISLIEMRIDSDVMLLTIYPCFLLCCLAMKKATEQIHRANPRSVWGCRKYEGRWELNPPRHDGTNDTAKPRQARAIWRKTATPMCALTKGGMVARPNAPYDSTPFSMQIVNPMMHEHGLMGKGRKLKRAKKIPNQTWTGVSVIPTIQGCIV